MEITEPMPACFKIRLVALIACMSLTACATPGSRVVLMSPKDIETFHVDCDRKEQQLKFLQDNLLVAKNRSSSRLILHSLGTNLISQADGSYDSHTHRANGWSEALIRRHISYLQTWCP